MLLTEICGKENAKQWQRLSECLRSKYALFNLQQLFQLGLLYFISGAVSLGAFGVEITLGKQSRTIIQVINLLEFIGYVALYTG